MNRQKLKSVPTRSPDIRWILTSATQEPLLNPSVHREIASVVRITRAGLPTATESLGISRVTTEPAPIVLRSPTRAITTADAPIQQSKPIASITNSPL